MCRSETGEQHTLLLVGEHDMCSVAARHRQGYDACWCLRARLRASQRACVRIVLYNVRSWSSQRQQQPAHLRERTGDAGEEASSHGHGGAHGWRICNRLCTLEGLVWVLLLDAHGSGRRRGTLRYTYRHRYRYHRS